MGIGTTGRVITSAALIMVSVFFAFIINGDPTVKQFGVGMGVAVAVDATLVRCLLVPAVMVLVGRANWWFPRSSTGSCRTSRSRARNGSASATRSWRRRSASASRLTPRLPAVASLVGRGEIAQLVEHTTENRGVPVRVRVSPLLKGLQLQAFSLPWGRAERSIGRVSGPRVPNVSRSASSC